MNRREFTRNMLAAAAAPALPMPALAKAQAVVIPKAARFWAIYMTHMHGDVTPGMLTQMTGIAPAQTTAIRAKLIADNVIAPTGFIRKSVAAQTIMRSQEQTQTTLAKIKAQSEKTTEALKKLTTEPQETADGEELPKAREEPDDTTTPEEEPPT